jgi:hypothetical protein
VLPLDHFKLLFDAHKHGRELVLTDMLEDEFGVAFIPPALSHLIGFGSYNVNMTFEVSFANTCPGTKFVMHYGSKKPCMFAREGHGQHDHGHAEATFPPEIAPGRMVSPPLPLPKPCFDLKPIPWPKNPEEDREVWKPDRPEFFKPAEEDFTDFECDGISMALVSGGSSPGLYIAMEEELLYSEGAEAFENKDSVQIELKYSKEGDDEYMQFFLDGIPLTPSKVPFSSDDVAKGSQLYPKLSIMAASGQECPTSHHVSKVWFQMSQVLVGSQCESYKEIICPPGHEEEMEDLLKLNDHLINFHPTMKAGDAPNQPEMQLSEAEAKVTYSTNLVVGSLSILIAAVCLAIHMSKKSKSYIPL